MLCRNCEEVAAAGGGIDHICEESGACTCSDKENCWRDTDAQGRAIYPKEADS